MRRIRITAGDVSATATFKDSSTADAIWDALPVEGLGAATVEIEFDPSVLDAISCDSDPDNDFDSGFCNPDCKGH